ncbi:MAG: serine/threonine-protein kinase [Salinibacter sp.]
MDLPGPDRWNEINTILTKVLERPPDEREAVLAEACAGDPALRNEVEELLDASTTYGNVLDEGAEALARPLFESDASGDADRPAVPVTAGQRVGPYRVLERVGAGGTSVVFRARREDEQFQRDVALKVLRHPLDDEGPEAERFRAERQILASVSHPHLAAVYDGGVLGGGQPYLAMEYVDGRSITEHCREEELSVDGRLSLFRQAAEAVQAAHEQMIVHRDLKPSNVLVDQATGAVKLVDFGIAKILGELPGAPSPVTQTGRHPMTPAYAAPEQVKGEAISLATDTYALGVLLYELLADRRPFGERNTGPYAVARAVCEDDPPPPSTCVEEERQRAVNGDLDAIVLKALRKRPDERYDTVEALLDDLRRHQDERPVQAYQGSLAYRARKFVRRNRGLLAGTTAATLIVVGLVVYHIQRLSAERNQAQREAQKAEQVSEYLAELFAEADPEEAQGSPTTARELLAAGVDRINELDDQPAVQGELAFVLAKTRRRLGLYDTTEALLTRAHRLRTQVHGREHPDVAETLSEKALLARDHDGDYAEAESLMQESAAIYRAVHGERHASVAEQLKDLVYVQRRQGKLDAAEASVREALSIRRAQPDADSMAVAETLFNLAAILRDRKQYERAEDVQQRSLALSRQHTEGPHPGTAANLDAMGFLLKEQEDLEAAEAHYQEALSMKRDLYGTPHPRVVTTLNNLGKLAERRGRYEEAETHLRSALRMRRALQEEPHPKIAVHLHNLGGILHDQGDLASADSALQAARDMLQATDQGESTTMAHALEKHGNVLRAQERYTDAEAAYQQALALRQSIHEEGHPKIPTLQADLESLYDQWGKPELAAQYRGYAE